MESPAILPKLEEYLTATPEVAKPVRQAFEMLAGATVGHRISKYGVKYAVVPALKATGVPALKDYADPISRAVWRSLGCTALHPQRKMEQSNNLESLVRKR
jgi:hypothetical protein